MLPPFSTTEEQLVGDQGMRNEAKKRGPAISPGSIQSIKGNVAKPFQSRESPKSCGSFAIV